MRILVTGAAGQLGRSLPLALAEHDLVGLERGQLDIGSLDAVRAALDAHRPALVINAAAFNDVDGAETNQVAAFLGNALGPRNLALATAAAGIPLVHVSTDYVFDGTATHPYHEFDRPNPRSVYGASKLAGEDAVRAHNPRHYIARTAWLYHPGGRNFPNTIRALADRGAVRVVSDQYGSPTYAPHLADALARLITTEAYGTYHLAGAGGASWFDLTIALFRHLGLKAGVEPVPRSEFQRPADRPHYSVLTTLQQPQILLPPWQDGLAEFARALTATP